jgi:hypothetical protein
MDHQRTDPIRQAIGAGEFQRATLLWNEYVTGILEEISRGTCTEAHLAEAADLLEWSRGVVLCECAHVQCQIRTLWVASRYDSADSPGASFVRTSL